VLEVRRLVSFGNGGGFSGARIWRVLGACGDYCLRAWPQGFSAERLEIIHQWMGLARASGLHFVPGLLATSSAKTWHEHGHRLWELTTWQPGRADFRDFPEKTRIESACLVLARIHNAWQGGQQTVGPCPAVLRRLVLVKEWTDLIQASWTPTFSGTRSTLSAWVERGWRLLLNRRTEVMCRLTPWRSVPVRTQPCLCDIWHDHVLFDKEKVTGIIDFGAAKMDHVAVDLARLLGSMVGDQEDYREAGLAAYCRICPLSSKELELIDVLDETGTILGIGNWLTRIYRQNERFDDESSVVRRLSELVMRAESWRDA
jgi:Ser/Thr protein kinase RdoA (MazF antagonist)